MKKEPQSLFVKFFSSVQLAVVLFILLAITTLIGTCLPQEPFVGKEALMTKYGANYELFSAIGITDTFHSWWYICLLCLLALNLTVASIYRVFPGYKKAFLWPQFLAPGNKIQSSDKAISTNLELDKWEDFRKTLRQKGWQIKFNENNDSLVAQKGGYHRLGPSVTHIGILTIMLGAFISLLWGFNGTLEGVKGDRFILSDRNDSQRSYILVESSKIFHSPLWLGTSPEFEVEIGETKREDYEEESKFKASGIPKQWTTDLLFLSNTGNKIKEDIVSVNHPVKFRGVDFYQADWKRVLKLSFNGRKFEIPLDKLSTKSPKQNNEEALEVAFTSVSEELGLLFLMSNKDNKLNLISVFGKPSPQMLQQPSQLISNDKLKLIASLSPGEEAQIGPMKFKFLGAHSKTGIQYKKSPGDWLMIFGMSILIIGVLIAFGPKRIIWAVKETTEGHIFVLGKADRQQEYFNDDFKRILLNTKNQKYSQKT